MCDKGLKRGMAQFPSAPPRIKACTWWVTFGTPVDMTCRYKTRTQSRAGHLGFQQQIWRVTLNGRWTHSWSGQGFREKRLHVKIQKCTIRRSRRDLAKSGNCSRNKRRNRSLTRRSGLGPNICNNIPTTNIDQDVSRRITPCRPQPINWVILWARHPRARTKDTRPCRPPPIWWATIPCTCHTRCRPSRPCSDRCHRRRRRRRPWHISNLTTMTGIFASKQSTYFIYKVSQKKMSLKKIRSENKEKFNYIRFPRLFFFTVCDKNTLD